MLIVSGFVVPEKEPYIINRPSNGKVLKNGYLSLNSGMQY